MHLNQIVTAPVALVLLLASPLLSAETEQVALSERAVLGEGKFAVCKACHDDSLKPPQAPPMFGVQRRYKQQFESQQEFVDAIVKFVTHPTESEALMKGPVKKLGLMPGLPLGDDMLSEIATYIYEERFEPPCEHWAQMKSSEKGEGKGKGKGKHRQHVQTMYEEFCQ